MNKQLHTQGRLVVTNSRLFSEGFGIDCICNMQVSNQPCWEEDAHRLAACWNACIGIGTEVLEKMPDGSFLNSVAGVLKERNELLALAERLVQWDLDYPVNCHNGYAGLQALNEIIRDNKAAIAKAKGDHPFDTRLHGKAIAELQGDGHLGGDA